MWVKPGLYRNLGNCFCCLLIIVFCSREVRCQNLDAPRFFKFSLQSFSATSSPIYGGSTAPVLGHAAPNYLIEASLRFPIKLKGRTQFIGKVDIDQEVMFGFWEESEAEIEDVHLYDNSLSVIMFHDFNETWRLYSTLKMSTSSTRALDWRRGSHALAQASFLEKRTDKAKWGIGLATSLSTNVSILPILKYEGPIFGRWNLDLFVPAKILINRRLNASNKIFTGLRASSANYLLGDNAVISDLYTNSSYRRINLKAVLGYEHQLTPWVGLSAEVGAALPYRSGLYDLEQPSIELHDFGRQLAPHVSFGVFLSLPK